jgi:hypothetical protein
MALHCSHAIFFKIIAEYLLFKISLRKKYAAYEKVKI